MDRAVFTEGLVRRFRYVLQQHERAASSRAAALVAAHPGTKSFASTQADIHEINMTAALIEVAEFLYDADDSAEDLAPMAAPMTSRCGGDTAADEALPSDSLGDPEE
jgi:hypothetical protein